MSELRLQPKPHPEKRDVLKAHLSFAGNGNSGTDVELPTAAARFGRNSDCDVQLTGAGVSRQHFQIQHKGAFHLLTDLNSTRGTFVNGNRVASRILQDGDQIAAGDVTLLYHVEQDDPSSSTVAFAVQDGGVQGEPGDNGLAYGAGNIVISRNTDTRYDLGTMLDDGENNTKTIGRLKEALDTIYRVSSLILSEDNLDVLFNTVMDVVMDVIKPDRAYLVMWHPEHEEIEPVVVRRRSDGDGDGNGSSRESTRRRSAADDELGLSRGVVLESIKKSLAIISEDARIDPRFKNAPSVQAQGIRSAMCVPVRSSAQRIGAIYVDSLTGNRRFEEHELELLTAIGRQAGLAIERARMYEDMETLFYSCVRALVTSIEAKDAYTAGHSERVAAFSITIAEEMNLSPDDMDNVKLGALLHDVGKIGVAEKILTKPSRLTPEEVVIIRAHPARGAEILGHIRNIPDVIAAVRWHHEMWNGLGYPDGLEGEEIPLTARIVAVADAFDAMTSNRTYRRNFDVNEAIAEFQRCSGDQFAPEVCEAMQNLLRDGRIIPCNDLFARGIDISSRVY